MSKDTTKFDFGGTKESAESTELKVTEQTSTPTDAVNVSADASEKTEDNKKTDKKKKREEPKKAGNVLVSYLGQGVWIDAEHEHWSKNAKPDVDILANRTYTNEEYEARGDLKFMVNYGEMSAVEV